MSFLIPKMPEMPAMVMPAVKDVPSFVDKEREKAERGKKVAISLPNVTVGRQINEGDVLFSAIPEEDFRKLKELKKHLKKEEIKILKEIAVIMRKKNEMWGV